MNWIEATSLLEETQPTYSQIDRPNLSLVMYVKRIVIIITYAATNRGWLFTLNVY